MREKQHLQRHDKHNDLKRGSGERTGSLTFIDRLLENFVQNPPKPNLPERSDTSRAPGALIMCGVRANALTGIYDLISHTEKAQDGGHSDGKARKAKLVLRGLRLCLN